MGEGNLSQVPAVDTITDMATQAPASFARPTARSSASTWGCSLGCSSLPFSSVHQGSHTRP